MGGSGIGENQEMYCMAGKCFKQCFYPLSRGIEKKLFAFLKCSLTIFHRELKKKRNEKIFEHWMTIQEGLKNMTTTKKNYLDDW